MEDLKPKKYTKLNKSKRPMQGSLTEDQKKYKDFIVEFINTHGYAPTRQEIVEAIGGPENNSISNVQYFLNELQKKNHIKLISRQERNIQVIDEDQHENYSMKKVELLKVLNESVSLGIMTREQAEKELKDFEKTQSH